MINKKSNKTSQKLLIIKETKELIMRSSTELREFVDSNINIPSDMDNLKQTLRSDIEEMTTSSNIEVGPPEHSVPAGSDFKKDKLPGTKDKAKHKVSPKEVEDIEDTPDSERTGYTGTQPGNVAKTPQVKEDDEQSDDNDEDEEDEEEDNEESKPTNEDIIEYMNSLDDQGLDAFLEDLDETELDNLDQIISEREETLPNEIDGSNPPAIGSEDEKDGMDSVDTVLSTPQKKKHTAKRTEIMPETSESILRTAIAKATGKNIQEKELTPATRENLPTSAFVFPKTRAYPIHDESHARNALARVAQHGSPAEISAVKKAVAAKYPEIGEPTIPKSILSNSIAKATKTFNETSSKSSKTKKQLKTTSDQSILQNEIIEARGEGMGVGGPRQGDGGTDRCVCNKCGHTIVHQRGIPCTETTCPNCGSKMIGK